ncbi:uncharacterized protein LOC112569048 isoform X2 [Pomacea canaliculata]|uniref:uncharacterized protein LOC112569048 isoform X2 n=1 Tax=Pomacea canaliculata TaxID=400727 RepID=UPI000D73ACE3|nr:uncharacterized protein LOC112569048 isoform X2 [Pomacea canaliculata]
MSDTLRVELQCPALYQDGENIITCNINKTAMAEAQCLSLNGTVTFELSLNSEKRVACHLPFDPGMQCIPRHQHSPGSCWCEESSGDIITYKFSYMASTTHDRGRQLECSLRVCSQKSLNISVTDGCTNIKFAGGQNSIFSFTIEDFGTVVALVIIAVMITLSIIMFCQRFCRCFFKKKRDDDTTSAGARYMKITSHTARIQ